MEFTSISLPFTIVIQHLKVIKPYFIHPPNITLWFKLLSSGKYHSPFPYFTLTETALVDSLSLVSDLFHSIIHMAAKIISPYLFHFIPLIKYYRGAFWLNLANWIHVFMTITSWNPIKTTVKTFQKIDLASTVKTEGKWSRRVIFTSSGKPGSIGQRGICLGRPRMWGSKGGGGEMPVRLSTALHSKNHQEEWEAGLGNWV